MDDITALVSTIAGDIVSRFQKVSYHIKVSFLHNNIIIVLGMPYVQHHE